MPFFIERFWTCDLPKPLFFCFFSSSVWRPGKAVLATSTGSKPGLIGNVGFAQLSCQHLCVVLMDTAILPRWVIQWAFIFVFYLLFCVFLFITTVFNFYSAIPKRLLIHNVWTALCAFLLSCLYFYLPYLISLSFMLHCFTLFSCTVLIPAHLLL